MEVPLTLDFSSLGTGGGLGLGEVRKVSRGMMEKVSAVGLLKISVFKKSR